MTMQNNLQVLRISIDRNLSGEAALELASKFPSADLARANHVVLSLRGVEDADAAGIALLVRLQSQLKRRGASLEVVGASPRVRGLLDRIGIRHLFSRDVHGRARAQSGLLEMPANPAV